MHQYDHYARVARTTPSPISQPQPAPANHKHEHEHKHGKERNEGPFDETDIELQLGTGRSSSKRSTCDTALRIGRYCSILLLGLVTIATTLHFAHAVYHPNIDISSHVQTHLVSSEVRSPSEIQQSGARGYTIASYLQQQDLRCIGPECVYEASVRQSAPPRGTATSPPICLPPHCYPHPPPGHHHDGDETDPPRVTATSPPSCVPPHCYPHPPPGHDKPDHHHDGDEIDPPRVTATSPPSCVPPHCYPHRPTGDRYDSGERLAGHILHEQENQIPPPCYPPHCYPPPLQSLDDEVQHQQDVEDDISPPICVPPHCYPHPQSSGQQLHDDNGTEVVDGESPPICVPPHCYPTGPSASRYPDSDPPTLPDLIEEDDGYRSESAEFEGLGSDQVLVIEDPMDGQLSFSDEVEDGPICTPPICLPPVKSPPVCAPPHCVPEIGKDEEGEVSGA